jgi:hypothetical protein
MILRRQLDVMAAQASDRCLRRSERGAQVVADRREQHRPHPVSLRDGLGRRGRRSRLPGVAYGFAG